MTSRPFTPEHEMLRRSIRGFVECEAPRRWPRRGETVCALGITEPGAGSDMAALTRGPSGAAIAII